MKDGTTYLYRAFDASGTLLYVGIAKNWASRWVNHADRSAFFSDVTTLDVETYPDRASALEAEREAIKAEHPLYNVKHAPPAEVEAYCHGCSLRIDPGAGYLEVDTNQARRAVEHDQLITARHPDGYWTGSDLIELGKVPEASWQAWHETCDPDPDADTYWIAVERLAYVADLLEWNDHLHEKGWLDHTNWDDVLRRAGTKTGPLRLADRFRIGGFA